MAGRRLGQHFLARRSILEQIASAACPDPDKPVVEIGPGRGALTEYLLKLSSQVHAIELDQVLVHYLREKFRDHAGFSVQHGDVLRTDLNQWGPVQVAGNLPYYITSPIIERVLALGPNLLRAVFLVQKEVADRVVAQPGSRDYGYLSVQVQVFAEPKYSDDRSAGRLSASAEGRLRRCRISAAGPARLCRSERANRVRRVMLPSKAENAAE